MESGRKIVETLILQQPENKLLTASTLYLSLAEQILEANYYKILARLTEQGILRRLSRGLYYRPRISKFGEVPFCEEEIVRHYMEGGQGVITGYRLYRRYGLTSQNARNIEILSAHLAEERRTIGNISIRSLSMELDENIRASIEALEILQNYSRIEDVEPTRFNAYMHRFAAGYREEAVHYVLKRRRYKKSTIAFLAHCLDCLQIKNDLQRYLSPLTQYTIPILEEFP